MDRGKAFAKPLFCLFQAVMYQALLTNNLLSQPLPNFHMLFWSGLTLYNQCQEFQSCHQALKYFEFEPNFHSKLRDKFNLWCRLLDVDTSLAPTAAKPVSRRKKGKDKKVLVDKVKVESDGEELVVSDENDFDVNNRFARLALK